MRRRFVADQRFIPTPVGNTLRSRTQPDTRAVHPHACGEHLDPQSPANGEPGSSPRLWGTPVGRRDAVDAQRFIPTPVGNTAAVIFPKASMSVHPHACGEHFSIPRLAPRRHGSSPRLWGTHAVGLKITDQARFIPTPVGNTPCSSRSKPAGPVHPHACGEHGRRRRHTQGRPGSSPRLWGTL